jgi:hypothetical protein
MVVQASRATLDLGEISFVPSSSTMSLVRGVLCLLCSLYKSLYHSGKVQNTISEYDRKGSSDSVTLIPNYGDVYAIEMHEFLKIRGVPIEIHRPTESPGKHCCPDALSASLQACNVNY